METFIVRAVDERISSPEYTSMIETDKYYKGENPTLMNLKSELSVGGQKIDLTAAIRTPTGIFKRLIIQLCQSIWAYGVQLDKPETKAKLGRNFDKITEGISKKAALHGVSYGFWNLDHLQRFTALEYFPFKDERTAEDMAGIRFWRIDDDKPMYIQVFEIDGWSEYRRTGKSNALEIVTPKQTYKKNIHRDAISTKIVGGENYGAFPVIPMYANEEQISELTRPIKNKIDLSDFILSGFGDSVMRTKVIYWILQGFGGDLDELLKVKEEIEKTGLVAPQDVTGADAHTVDLPFAAVQYALDKLEEGIYLDFMGMQLSEITGGSLTNVAIQTAQYNLNLKVSDFEWQAFQFVQKVLALQGIQTENIRFKKKSVSNDMEIVQMLMMCRSDLDLQTALEKNPLVDPDEVEIIMTRKAEEDLGIGGDGAADDGTVPTDGTEVMQ